MSFKERRARPAAAKAPKSHLDENLLRQVREEVAGGRIACASAFALAEKLKVSRAKLGQVLDELGIKIERCQLGCF